MVQLLDRRHTAVLMAVVCVATFMDGLDGSIVNVALPEIGESFGVDTATISWVAIIYFMVLAGTLVAFARLSADSGVRYIMAGGIGIFTAGSLVCGLSDSLQMLVLARAVQGLGAAMMAASGPICCTEHLPPERLGFGLAIITVGASIGFALGPAIGGFITEYMTWQWIFLINVPIGLIALPMALWSAPKTRKLSLRGVDWGGAGILFLAITAGTLALESASYPDRIAITIVSAVVFAASMAGFVAYEKCREHPLLSLSLFRRFDFVSIFVCLMLTNMSYMGMLYLIPFFGQNPMGESASTVGMIMLISAAVTAVFGMPFARISDRYGRVQFCVAAGISIMLSFIAFGLLAESMTRLEMCIIMVILGLGWAFVGGPMASRLVEHAGDERDMASSLMNEAYYVGGTIGTALVAMLFTFFSGTGGIDIADVPADMFIDGFVPCAFICAAMGLAILVLSVAVKDEKRQF